MCLGGTIQGYERAHICQPDACLLAINFTPKMISYRRINRQYVAMSEEEVWDYLEPKNTIYVAFVQDDGYPHLTPVWFVVMDRKLYFRGSSYKVKFRLARSAKVCCACDDGTKYK